MITLRPYQDALINDAREALRRVNRVLIQLPTGGGKTAIAAKMARNGTDKGFRFWFAVHRDFLLHQTAGAFDLEDLPFSYIAAKQPFNPLASIHLCGVATARRRLDRVVKPHVIVIDEAHHAPAETWAAILEWAGDRVKVIGLTATPCRLDGKGLDKYFDEMVRGPSVAELIAAGYLSEYKAYAPSTPDLTGVHTRGGDYAKDEVAGLMEDGQIVGDTVRHYATHCNGARAIYFCVSIDHSMKMAAEFCMKGIPAAHLDGTTPTGDRIQAARAFARGELRVLTNVDLFGEGYDLAAQAGMDVTIDAVGLCRPTKSVALHIQQMGRALRPHRDKPYAIILDHAGNLARHGLPDDDREWSLYGAPKKDSDSGDPIRQCPECFFVHSIKDRECPDCGHVYEVAETEAFGGRGFEEIEGELKEVDKEALRASRRREQGMAKTLEDLTDLARARGYKNPEKWAAHIWTAREEFRNKGRKTKVESQYEFYMGDR